MEPIVIIPFDESWAREFAAVGERVRQSLGETAIRIDHIGSTSVYGLDAKPIIDIQISVLSLERLEAFKGKLEGSGFVFREGNPDLTKRYFREAPGNKRTHIHVREHGSWSEQLSLLFRDYLRSHPEDCLIYAGEKRRLMELYRHERQNYVEGKTPVVWTILQKAHGWSMETGWRPGKSDA
ncbi:GrpB family protein [Paenibacillus piri]|uniref:GrpB family protein n=1 Tax=Paenibacillus piri TaxID=2547395 RepID=A0A4R5KUQ7_9BACL|nr:GrpB family protein [Paenibacillus piri]TDF99659.1 GrpB family protein [Paenibacillus piri]